MYVLRKKVLLTANFGDVVLCKNCGALISISDWKDREFLSLEELIEKKKSILHKAAIGKLSNEVVNEI